GAHHQQITILAERTLVSLQTAVEGVELGILRVGARIDLGGGAIAFAAHSQRIAFRVGEDHGALTLGGGADAGAGALPFGAQPAGCLREALLHALVDARGHLVGQIDALHAHVHQVDAQARRIVARLAEHLPRHRGALGRYDLLERALRHDALDAVLDDLGQPLAGQIPVRIANSVSLTVKSDSDASTSSTPAATSTGTSRELISALPARGLRP